MKNFIKALLFTLVGGLVVLAFSSKLSQADLRASTVKLNGGTGAVVYGKSGKKYILTNWHICVLSNYHVTELEAKFEDGQKVSGHIVYTSLDSDLCAALLRDSADLPALSLARSVKNVEVASRGYPAGVLTESHGILKGKVAWSYEVYPDVVGPCPKASTITYDLRGNVKSCTVRWVSTLTNLYSKPGSSGSPVVDDSGFLVGVISSEGGGEGVFAGGMVPFEDVKAFMDKL